MCLEVEEVDEVEEVEDERPLHSRAVLDPPTLFELRRAGVGEEAGAGDGVEETEDAGGLNVEVGCVSAMRCVEFEGKGSEGLKVDEAEPLGSRSTMR